MSTLTLRRCLGRLYPCSLWSKDHRPPRLESLPWSKSIKPWLTAQPCLSSKKRPEELDRLKKPSEALPQIKSDADGVNIRPICPTGSRSSGLQGKPINSYSISYVSVVNVGPNVVKVFILYSAWSRVIATGNREVVISVTRRMCRTKVKQLVELRLMIPGTFAANDIFPH